MIEDRRAEDYKNDGAYALAILYTIGYLTMLFALMLLEIPVNNRELLLTLVGIMSAAQLGIIKFYYDGSQGAVRAQAANITRSMRTDAVIQEIAKSAPAAVASVPATDPVVPSTTGVNP